MNKHNCFKDKLKMLLLFSDYLNFLTFTTETEKEFAVPGSLLGKQLRGSDSKLRKTKQIS